MIEIFDMKYIEGGNVMKKTVLLFVVLFSFAWGINGYSEAKLNYGLDVGQNFYWTKGLDLHDDGNNPVATRGDTTDTRGIGSGESNQWFETLLALNADASVKGLGGGDVGLHLRVASQFDWLGAQTSTDSNSTPGSTGIVGAGNYTNTGTNAFGFNVNQLYVKFNDFAGLPFDFTLGRQNLKLGRGFVLGDRLLGASSTVHASGQAKSGARQGPTGVGTGHNGQVSAGQAGGLPIGSSTPGILNAPEHGDFTGFDAARFDVKYKDFYANTGYALIASALTQTATGSVAGSAVRDIGARDDEELLFANVGVATDKFLNTPWTTELYVLRNTDREPMTDKNNGGANSLLGKKDLVRTYGARGDVEFKNVLSWFSSIKPFAEYAIQRGELGSQPTDGALGRNRRATGWDTGVDFKVDAKYSPWFSLETMYFSGPKTGEVEPDNALQDVAAGTPWHAWDSQFRSNRPGLIMAYADTLYLTDRAATDATAGTPQQGLVDSALTNRWTLLGSVGFKPIEKLDVSLTYLFARLPEEPSGSPTGTTTPSKVVGTELDGFFAYKFSKDVTWNLQAGWFDPGNYYRVPTNSGVGDADRDAFLVGTGFKFSI